MTAPLVMQNGWVIHWSLRANNREVVVGTELSLRGESGRYRFMRFVVGPRSSWIDVYGGKSGHEMVRSVRPERIKRVHRDRKMRQP